MAEIVRWRREHQPGGSNAGSVFTNPEGDSAGRLIEEAGLKGFGSGTAHVSEKHANFIQADKGGRADDVRAAHGARARGGGRALRRRRCSTEVRLLGFGDGETGARGRDGRASAEDARASGDGSRRGPAPAARGARTARGGRRGAGSTAAPTVGGAGPADGPSHLGSRRTAVTARAGPAPPPVLVDRRSSASRCSSAAGSCSTRRCSPARCHHGDRQRARDGGAGGRRKPGLAEHPPLLDVNAGAAAARIEQLPWVRRATVRVSWPDGVHIAVTEETPRFVASAPGGRWAA